MSQKKSSKLRTIHTLRILYKYSDEKHRFSTRKLNEHLKPLGLECTARVLSDTVDNLRKCGVNVGSKGRWEKQGVWIEDKLISDENFKLLMFAITSNPHLTKEEKGVAVDSVKPFLTIYQEDDITDIVNDIAPRNSSATPFQVYCAASEAIKHKKQLRCFVSTDDSQIKQINIVPQLIRSRENGLEVVGYKKNKLQVLKFADILDIHVCRYKQKALNTFQE